MYSLITKRVGNSVIVVNAEVMNNPVPVFKIDTRKQAPKNYKIEGADSVVNTLLGKLEKFDTSKLWNKYKSIKTILDKIDNLLICGHCGEKLDINNYQHEKINYKIRRFCIEKQDANQIGGFIDCKEEYKITLEKRKDEVSF